MMLYQFILLNLIVSDEIANLGFTTEMNIICMSTVIKNKEIIFKSIVYLR